MPKARATLCVVPRQCVETQVLSAIAALWCAGTRETRGTSTALKAYKHPAVRTSHCMRFQCIEHSKEQSKQTNLNN